MKKVNVFTSLMKINRIIKLLSIVCFVFIAGILSPSVAQVTSGTTWKSFNVSTQTGTFTVQFDLVMSLSNTQGYITVQNGTITDTPQGACIIYVHQSGVIWARNGSSYTSNGTVRFTAGTSYHFRLEINVPSHTYSIYITPSGGSETTLGANYAFRTEQSGVNQLTGWGVRSEAGTGSFITISNMAFTTPDLTAPSVPSGLLADNIAQTSFDLSWNASTDNVEVTSYEVFKDGVSIGTTASTSISVTELLAETIYAMTVRAGDAAGNWSAQSDVYNVTTAGLSTMVDYTIMPDHSSLLLNSPNPFKGETKILYKIPVPGSVCLKVFDITGIEVSTILNDSKASGEYSFNWDASGLSSGIYFLHMSVQPDGPTMPIVSDRKLLLTR